MKSKAEIIRNNLRGMRVLDIGGTGYEEDNAYEAELRDAWSVCSSRLCMDNSPNADVTADLNSIPLPTISQAIDVATAFDVLEHLEHPVDVLRWIPCERLIVTLPNALSWIARRMEESNKSRHLFSFTPYTASIMLGAAGWHVREVEFQFGKWSIPARAINAVGSLCPKYVGTGIVLHCDKSGPTAAWRLR